MTIRMRHIAVIITGLILLPSLSFTDSVRGPVSHLIEIDGLIGQEPVEIILELEDLAGISVSRTAARFLEGLEIGISIPASAQKYRDSFAIYIYKKVTPNPSMEIRSYRGTEAEFLIIPMAESMYIKIPVAANHDLSSSFDSPVLQNLALEKDSPLLLTVVPVMKGLPTAAAKSLFTVSVKPLFFDRGIVKFNLTAPKLFDPDTAVYTIDGVSANSYQDGFILDSGFHNVLVRVPGFEDHETRVAVSRGAETIVPVSLTPKKTTITISAPSGTQIILDGDTYDGQSQPTVIEAGEHIIVFKLGGHSVSKKINVSSGDSVSVSLLLDISVDYE